MSTAGVNSSERVYLLDKFSLGDTLALSADIRRITASATTLEAASAAIVRHLYDRCTVSDRAGPANVLVRMFKTHALGDLELRLQRLAKRGTESLPPETTCLTLMATAGDETSWNSRQLSKAHQVIPLRSVKAVEQAPMIARILTQFGLDLGAVVARPRKERTDLVKKFEIFHEEEASGSAHIPAQDFVQKYGVRSVLGFGGALRSGDMFAVIMFSRAHIRRETAQRFKLIGLDVKSAIFRFDKDQVFERTETSA